MSRSHGKARPGFGSPLPVQPTTFVGRRRELAQLRQLLDNHRLVTITGPGGVGKTRLAVAAAGEDRSQVAFVDLAAVGPDLVVAAVAAAIGVTGRPSLPLIDAVQARLGAERVLLILDNCEHVVDAVSPLAGRLITACPGLVVLATSRERLGVAGEYLVAVPPLSLVDPVTRGPAGSEAVTLFLDRARAVAPQLDADVATVAEVCARCDGLPLAIELAAARCGSLGIDGLLAGLDDRLRLLAGSRVTNQRHRSLRAVLDWSYELLGPGEQALFRRLGMFAGGFDMAAVTAVASDLGSAAELVDRVGRLTDQNLLERQPAPAGSRWRMLELVRSYARDQLAAAGEQAQVRDRYQRWAGGLATRLEQRLDTGEPWREEFEVVASDLRAALAGWSGSLTYDQRLTLALAMANLHARNGAFTLAQTAYEEVTAMARATGDAVQFGRAALGASLSGMLFGVTADRRVNLLEEALARLGPARTGLRARLTARLATELYWSPDPTWSRTLADEALAIADGVEDDGARAHALYARHYVTRSPGNWPQRLELAERIMGCARRGGERQLELAGLAARVAALLEAGELTAMDAAVATLGEAADRLDHPEFQWYAAVYRLVRALVSGHGTDADQLAAAATASAEHAPEFAIGLFFAEAVTDLRELDRPARRARCQRLHELADRFPRVLVWRCLALLDELALRDRPPGSDDNEARAQAHALTSELLKSDPRDGHWLVAGCLLAEAVAALSAAELAAPLSEALAPYAANLAVAGRVAAFRGSVRHALGLLAVAGGQPDRAATYLAEAAEQHLRIGAHPYHARSEAALAALCAPTSER